MTEYVKLLNHPDRDVIITKLTAGESVRSVSAWLKTKYPTNKSLQISHPSLHAFRVEHLNINGTILEELKLKVMEQEEEEKKEKLSGIVKKNKTYQEKLEEAVDTQIDWKEKLTKMLNAVETRFGELYDIAQNNPNNFKPDRYMIEWFNNILKTIELIRKIEGAPDQIIQHNVAIQTIDKEVSFFQEAFRSAVMQSLEPHLASKVIDTFYDILEKLKHPQEDSNSLYADSDVKKLNTMMANILPDNFDDKGKNGSK